MALAELADRASSSFKSHRTNSLVAEGRTGLAGPRLILAKPATFMNVSGGPVAGLMRFYKIEPDRLIVIHDELDIPFDTIRIKSGGGHGGHNGVRDIIAAIGTGDFLRIRVGVGRPPGRQSAADYVLRDFVADERKVLPNLLADAADAVEQIASDGVSAAQMRFHTAAPE
jgi:PTH1 family peptidyl-tRNA hydrolase